MLERERESERGRKRERERGREGEVCLTETGQRKEKQFIFMLL